jgi:pimeloyl-ACP methyl ester carboxylesterase
MTLHRVVEGDRPPLVLASSFGTTYRLWHPNVATLRSRCSVVRYDHPGHGGSPPGPPRFTGDRARWRTMLLATPAEGYARSCEAIAAMDLRDEVRAIRVPATVILGRHDPVVDDESKRLLAFAGPIVDLDAAHLANVEQPKAFVEALAR